MVDQTETIESFRARVEEAIIQEINDSRNAVEHPAFRQGLRVARIILNREAETDAKGPKNTRGSHDD
jgi:hypothetical protein